MCDYKSKRSNHVEQHTLRVHEGIKRLNRNHHDVQNYESVEEKVMMINTRTSSTEGLGNGTLNTSIAEYDIELSALLEKTQNVWRCIECNYNSKHRGHVKEHIEKHIEGYSFECQNCDKSFTSRKGLRTHKHTSGH